MLHLVGREYIENHWMKVRQYCTGMKCNITASHNITKVGTQNTRTNTHKYLHMYIHGCSRQVREEDG